MKRIIGPVFILAAFCTVNAQRITISFQPRNSGSTIDSALVTNQRTGQTAKISGNGSLILTSSTGTCGLPAGHVSELLFPNPSTGEATFFLPVEKRQQVIVGLYDITGRLAASRALELEKGLHRFSLRYPGAGLFHVVAVTGEKEFTSKAVSLASAGGAGIVTYEGNDNPGPLKMGIPGETLEYEPGDILNCTLYAGGNVTIISDSPEASTQYPVEFYNCQDPGQQNYPVVQIGSQWWMAQNLAYLPAVSPSSQGSVKNPHYYVYGYEGSDIGEAKRSSLFTTYGVLYNWAAAMAGAASSNANPSGVRGVCPEGWHLPSDAEWKQLEVALGMAEDQLDLLEWRGTDQGLRMKTSQGWRDTGNGTNATGFSGLPGGNRYSGGYFHSVGGNGVWRSSTAFSDQDAWTRDLDHYCPGIFRFYYSKADGFSIRCVKDAGSGPPNRVPLPPSDPTPVDQATGVPISASLGWACSDPDGDALTYSVYLDIVNPPLRLLSAGLSGRSAQPDSLSHNQTYYWQVEAADDLGLSTTGPVWTFTTLAVPTLTCIDPDGRSYDTVRIGTQVWMAENLAYLPAVSPSNTGSQSSPQYYVYGYNGNQVAEAKAHINYVTYGVLYNWAAALAGSAISDSNPSGVRGICPAGWHLPSDAEWKQLEMTLGMTPQQAEGTGYRGSDQGSRMKTTTGWSSNGNGTNSSGFSALPGGTRTAGNVYIYLGVYGCWWSSTIWSRFIDSGFTGVGRFSIPKENGLSIRCVRD